MSGIQRARGTVPLARLLSGLFRLGQMCGPEGQSPWLGPPGLFWLGYMERIKMNIFKERYYLEGWRAMQMKSSWIKIGLSAFLIALMANVAYLLMEREIIFPEIAAIAAGALIAPQLPWQTDIRRLFFFIMLCTFLGMGIVFLVPLPLALKMCLAYLLGQFIFLYSQTTFAPMISAIVLPVMLGSRSVYYPLSPAVMTLLILLCRTLLIRINILSNNEYAPVPFPQKIHYKNMLIRCILVSLFIVMAIAGSFRFAVAPPLLVAFTELSNPASAGRKAPWKLVMVVTLCAVYGSLSRSFFCLYLDFPVFPVVFFLMVLVYGTMTICSFLIPPAAAIALLAFLIPEESVGMFPVQVGVGIAVLTMAAECFFQKESQGE